MVALYDSISADVPAVPMTSLCTSGQRHKLVNASRHIVTVGSSNTPVYGMWFDPGFGMHVDQTKGVATGNDPESMYAVMSGKHYNGTARHLSHQLSAHPIPASPLGSR